MIKSKTLHSWCVIAREFLAESDQKIGHSHLQEIFANGLGFRTYAAIPDQFFASLDQATFAVLSVEAMHSRVKSLGYLPEQHNVFERILRRVTWNPTSYMYEIHKRLIGAIPIEAGPISRHLCEWAARELRVKNVKPPEGAFAGSASESWIVALDSSRESSALFFKSEQPLQKEWEVSGSIYFDGVDRLCYQASARLYLYLPELSKNLIGEPVVKRVEVAQEFEVEDMDHYSDGSAFCTEISD